MKTITITKVTSAWRQFALSLAAGAAVMFGAGAATAQAQLITPVAATAQSSYTPDGRLPDRAFNGSGMTPNNPVVTTSTCGNGPANAMWLSDATPNTWITFDLGSVRTVGGFHLWNYNENSGNPATFTRRGVQTAGIYAGNSLLNNNGSYASGGAAWGTLVENMIFTKATGLATYAGEDYFFATPVTTRYLQIYVTSNFGPPGDAFTGISEIRFITANIPATITAFGANVPGSSAVISPVVANAGTIAWTVPFGTSLATLAPTFTLNSPTTACNQTSGAVPSPDFSSGAVTYTVTDGAVVNTYTVTAVVGPPSPARDILTFNPNLPGTTSSITSTGPNTGTIVVYLPTGSPAAIASTLAPSFTLSGGATCNQVSGVKPTPNLSMTGAVTYTVTAQDGISTKDYSVTVQRTGWAQVPWTGDADSGIGGPQADYTVAVNMGTADTAPATVNFITFAPHAMSGLNYTLTGNSTNAGRPFTNVSGDSDTLARNFTHGANNWTLTLNNLTAGTTYETSFYTYGWDATPGRTQVFDSNGDNFLGDGSAYGDGNGARITYTFVAAASSKVITIAKTPTGIGPFHISAMGNRIAPPPSTVGDTDMDDLADSWELDKAGNRTDLTGLLAGPGPGPNTGDFDDDGLSDAEEYVLRLTYPALNPKVADTDGDGLSDRAEIYPTAPRLATNPTLVDSDGDGLNDSIESNSGVFVNAGNPGTNPNSIDSDGDLYPDDYEINQGGNPVLNTAYPTVLPAGIALGVVTDEASTGIQVSDLATYTHKISGGGAATVNGVVLDVLDTGTTPPNFTWNVNAGTKTVVPPITRGTWNEVAGNVTGAGNLQFFGGFTFNDGGATPGSKQQFTLSALEAGRSYELRLFIRKWANDTTRPQYLKFTNGAQVTNYFIIEDRPGTVLGNGNDDSAYYISFTYVAQSTTMTMEATVANGPPLFGSFHMYGLTNRSTSPPAPLELRIIKRAPILDMGVLKMTVTLDIQSRPNRFYLVEFSTDLVNWQELDDFWPSAGTGTSTIYLDTFAAGLPKAFYRVTDVTPP